MADESFSNTAVAKLLNEHFIPIKIDREERPDIDRVYMDFLQVTTGGGGWPLNVFVTPQLEPIYGGTYWPGPESERAEAGGSFDEILEKIATAWNDQESKCRENASQITAQLKQFAQEGNLNNSKLDGESGLSSDLPDLQAFDDAFQHFKNRFDPENGGFGGAPKFPTPAHLSFLLRMSCWPKTMEDILGVPETDTAGGMAVKTLESMALGGIKDQIGHGFARYSVTRNWSLPHFEKMLYDNAQLLSVYLDAYLTSKNPLFLEIVHDVATYLTSNPIQSRQGGYHASEDADSALNFGDETHREGAFYVWTFEDFMNAIEDEKAVQICADYFGVQQEGNISPRHDPQGELAQQNTLCIVSDVAQLAQQYSISEEEVMNIIQTAKVKLARYRDEKRPRPGLDDKILVSWNGMAIASLARTAFVISAHNPGQAQIYLSSAMNAANFIRQNLYSTSDNTLKRVFREGAGDVPGFADDYAFFISGLLELYNATSDISWLQWAYELQQTQIKLFFDHESQGSFYSTAIDNQDILIRTKDAMDNAEPSTNGVSVTNLLRLGALLPLAVASSISKTEKMDFTKLATNTLKTFEVEIDQHPGLMTGILNGLAMGSFGVKSVLITGSGNIVDNALQTLREKIWPDVVVTRLDSTNTSSLDWLKSMNPVLKDLDLNKEMVQVCFGQKCLLVNNGGDSLADILSSS